ncbi:hypothetical protein HZ996_06980 [Cryomorphaceae bacterium]|nr:hypothetical protein HZ996_06980 [Cryomorphaceae bacterium]
MKNIQQVLDELDEIIARSSADQSAHGFFATLYRQVTADVARGIAEQRFEDNARMEELDVVFAQRYLDAYNSYQSGDPCTESWRVAFDADRARRSILLQYLMLGMNAHINLDLGIAASQVMKDQPINSLKKDFDRINELLAARVDESQDKIARRSWLFGLLDRWMKNSDEWLAKFSINAARDGAWAFAEELHQQAQKEALIESQDQRIAEIGHFIEVPEGRVRWLLRLIKWTENQRLPWND